MKVMLIVPTFHYAINYPAFLSFSDFPTGLGYIAASLKKSGHKVIGCNPNNIVGYVNPQAMLADVLQRDLREQKPDMIGLTGLCTDYAFIKDAITVIRSVTNAPIVLGGNIVSNDAEFIMNDLKPDYCVKWDGEDAIVALARRDFAHTIDNIGYWCDGKAVFTKENFVYGDLNERTFPDYEPFGISEMLDKYSESTRVLYKYTRPYPRVWSIVASRGCPFKCTFCIHNHGPKYRARTIENIMQEIKQTYETYKFNILLILDELFAVNKKRLNEFSQAMIEYRDMYGWDFDWTFQCHPTASFDIDALKLAKQAGCYLFSYGLESASPTVLASMNKRSNIEKIKNTIKMAHEAKLGFSGNLIFGDFAETEDTIKESLKFWLDYGNEALIFLSNVTPYPGGKIFDRCIEKGIIKDKKKYYETIDKITYNMTALPDNDIIHRLQGFNMLETSWLFCKSTVATKVEEEPFDGNVLAQFSGNMQKVYAKCPHCGHDNMYRLRIVRGNKTYFGVGCLNCQKKVRVDIV